VKLTVFYRLWWWWCVLELLTSRFSQPVQCKKVEAAIVVVADRTAEGTVVKGVEGIVKGEAGTEAEGIKDIVKVSDMQVYQMCCC
jgi:hypothetical protein